MKPEEVKRLILEEGLSIEAVIDAIIEVNGFVGVGIISFKEIINDYIDKKHLNHGQQPSETWLSH